MDLRQFRYYIEGTEQMSFTRGARLPPLRWPKTNFTPTQPMISIEMGMVATPHREQFRALVHETLSLSLAMFSDMVCR